MKKGWDLIDGTYLYFEFFDNHRNYSSHFDTRKLFFHTIIVFDVNCICINTLFFSRYFLTVFFLKIIFLFHCVFKDATSTQNAGTIPEITAVTEVPAESAEVNTLFFVWVMNDDFFSLTATFFF